MIAYVDSSVLLRVECLRTLENDRRRISISDEDLALRRAAVLHLLEARELVHPDPIVPG